MPPHHDLQILRLIDEGTASKTGTEFFRALVRALAGALESRFAFVSRFCDDYSNVHVIALWTGRELQEDFRYPLKGSPCEAVLGGEIVAINSGVVELFPAEREDLSRMSAEAYLAIPLRNPAGRVLGHLAAIATEAKNWQERDFGILRIFAARATAEIERQAAEQELRDANAELARRVELEHLITSLSTRFVSASVADIERLIDQAIGAFGAAMGADRGLLFRFDDECRDARLTNEWVRGGTPLVRNVVPALERSRVPAVLDYFLARHTLISSTPGDLPPGFEVLTDLLHGQPVRSRVAVPLVCSERVRGILGFHSVSADRHWPAADLRLVGLLGEIIANGIVRHETETALAAALDAAEGASRAKSEFLASMSHELRTPLNGILGYAQLLRRDPGLGPHYAASVAAIERCGEHLLTLISDVLDLAKIEAGRLDLAPTSFDLDAFLHDVADVARVRALQGGLAFSLETLSALPAAVRADERKLRQILLNLLGNAIKFTPRGTVRLRVGAEPAGATRSRLRITVEDSGIGIATDDLERIFDPFHQLPQAGRPVEGTGLGLAICRKLVELLGGRLAVESRPGEGSRFSIEIDVEVAERAAATRGGALPHIVGYAGRRRRIVVADDKPDNRAVLCHLLSSLGFEVLEAADGRQAVDLVRRERPDAVMMDLVMPVLDGFEAIRELRADASLAGLRIVALSASAFDTTRAQSIAAGCSEFLAKPVRFDEVLRVLGRELTLAWLTADAPAGGNAGAPAPAAAPEVRLPAELARELYELALAGDVRALEQRLAELRASGEAPPDTIDGLEALARSFDMRGLRALLRPLVGSAA
ncbi:MAG: ATP-binding protein [Steroidobacteraceae bacterium]|nr:ATP-binding protein [Steroidobacteraceae bacterium]